VIPRLAGVLLVALAARAQAQDPRAVRAELRVDGLGNPSSVQLGGGLAKPVSTYARLAIVAAAGPAWRHGGPSVAARVDLLGRFVVDPFNESGRGVYAGGPSTSMPHRSLDAELGLGGGVRAGIVLRWMRGDGR
jgi:hypothetical protein